MYVTYLVTTILAALANGYAAFLNFVGAESVKVVADRVHVSQRWMVPLGADEIQAGGIPVRDRPQDGDNEIGDVHTS